MSINKIMIVIIIRIIILPKLVIKKLFCDFTNAFSKSFTPIKTLNELNNHPVIISKKNGFIAKTKFKRIKIRIKINPEVKIILTKFL